MNYRNLFILCLSWGGAAFAGAPLWTFTPLTATSGALGRQDTASVQYTVTNQSRKSHTLALVSVQGVTQITTGGACANPFTLAYQASCTLKLEIDGGDITQSITRGPVVCQTGSQLQCYQPTQASALNFTMVPPDQYTIGGMVSGFMGNFTIVNNGTNPQTLSADGEFTYATPVSEGDTYNITVQTQPSGYQCVVINGTGTMGSANVTDVTLSCY